VSSIDDSLTHLLSGELVVVMKLFPRFTLLFAVVLFSTGIMLGLKFSALQLSQIVEAYDLEIVQPDDKLTQKLNDPNNPLVQQGKLLAAIAKLTTPAVVHIQSERENPEGSTVEETGSGVIVSSSHIQGLFVVTNRHVILHAELEDITIRLSDGREIHPTRVWTDRATDVAVMKFHAKGVRTAHWGESNHVEIGDMVLAMGSPFGLSQSVTFGIISAKGRRSLQLGNGAAVLNQDFLQTDAAINPGNSGGPLIDMHGHVIGINTAIASNSGGNDGIGFSIPSNLVFKVMEDMLQFGYVKRAYLGVKLDPRFDAEAAKQFNLDRAKGARVVEVYPNTPAEKAGLQFDDIILSFDGKNVLDENHLINLVSLTPVGTKAQLLVLRNNKQVKVTVLLADRTKREKKRSEVPSPTKETLRIEPTGLQLYRLNRDLARQLGLRESQQGLLVLSIEESSPLSGKLLPGDLIFEVAGKPITSAKHFQMLLTRHQQIKSLLLKVKRSLKNGQSENRIIIWARQ